MDQLIAGSASTRRGSASPLLCMSHLRWDFVFQRPHHLLTRAARTRPVFFWEEPVIAQGTAPDLRVRGTPQGVTVVTPVLPTGLSADETVAAQRGMLDRLILAERLDHAVLWYYTPAALAFSAHHAPSHQVIYDCMDELSAFLGADPSLPRRERELMGLADLVFTGGFSLYEAKRAHHPSVHPFPSGVDVAHFCPARGRLPDPADQRSIGRPRLGFFGVIDERLDIPLLASVAAARPDWQIVLIGPVVKVDQAVLPRAANIHYLGAKAYGELPAYLGNWDVALLPFARNAATRFISPTKTPEYLAGGKPVVSTPITDVVRHYGDKPGVLIAGTADSFVLAVDQALILSRSPERWLPAIEPILERVAWDDIWTRMDLLICRTEAATTSA